MSSSLNKLFPTLKRRLIVTFILLLSVLIGIIFILIDYSIKEDLKYQLAIELEETALFLAEEYNEEFEDYYDDIEDGETTYNKQDFQRSSRRALRNFREELSEIKEILNANQQWLYLFDPEQKLLLSSNTKSLPVKNEEILSSIDLSETLEELQVHKTKSGFEYTAFVEHLPDNRILFVAVNNQQTNELVSTFRQGFLMAYIAIVIVAIILCSKIIQHSLIGFQKVRETADTIADGDYQQRVQITDNSPQEVTELSQSFNTMIDRTETLIKEIKDVTNNVAHDLRTPLTRIRGKIETSLMANANLKAHQELSGLVIEECDNLMQLIDNMLTLAEYESGLVPQKNEEIDLKLMLEQLTEVFDSVSEDKGITIIKNFCEKTIQISGDPSKLQRAFANLLDNAIKYSPENSQVTISLKQSDQNIELKFSDQGKGISEEDQVRIFERFYRVDSSRTHKGNGLGLNLAKAFIENHKGKLTVESEANKGSSFIISLPLN